MRYVSGQSVLEVLVGIGVVLVALLAIIQIATKSSTNSGFSKRQSMATTLAIEGIEWVKSQRQADTWLTFYGRGSNGGTIYCLNTLVVWPAAWTPGDCAGATMANSEFTRTATLKTALVTPPPAGIANQQLMVTVNVSWNESGRVSWSRQETVFLRY